MEEKRAAKDRAAQQRTVERLGLGGTAAQWEQEKQQSKNLANNTVSFLQGHQHQQACFGASRISRAARLFTAHHTCACYQVICLGQLARLGACIRALSRLGPRARPVGSLPRPILSTLRCPKHGLLRWTQAGISDFSSGRAQQPPCVF